MPDRRRHRSARGCRESDFRNPAARPSIMSTLFLPKPETFDVEGVPLRVLRLFLAPADLRVVLQVAIVPS